MTSLPAIDIPLSKRKTVFMLLGCAVFVAASWFIWNKADDMVNPTLFRGVAMAAFTFFGLVCGGYGLYKLFDNRPGLVLDSQGFRDNSSAIAGKLILWSEILSLKEREVMGVSYLLIYVKDPMEIMRKESFMKQKIMRLNHQLYGTPVALSAQALDCDFAKLNSLVQRYYDCYKPSV